MTDLTYREIGATRHEPLPDNYNHLHFRTLIGEGPEVFATAGEAIVTFAMHRGTGAQVRADSDRAAPGVRLTIGLGPVTVPCEVVYTLEEPNRTGFGYGTLPGHIERGEEAFLVERDVDGRVWFRVTAFSKPARWPAILGGPLAEVFQRVYARTCARSLKRVCAASRTVGS